MYALPPGTYHPSVGRFRGHGGGVGSGGRACFLLPQPFPRAASGRVHDADELVAAHRTYPFGTFLRVTNLANMKRVIVCVTDRGPFRKGRIIDVSAGAAELLGFKKKGLARVRIEVVPGKIDLSLLDLLYPKIPFLEVDHLRVKPPYRVDLKK